LVSDLAARFAAGQVGALARAISLVERDDPRADALFEALSRSGASAVPSVGFTGAPGAGKSTLVDAVIRVARSRDATVGVLAVDPSSPFSGGALLGDRLRMDTHLLDTGVFVRSMASRGQLGGLSPRAREAAWLLGAFGFDEVIVETVGTGQSELEIPTLVDTTLVVLTPGMGDDVQLEKAGIMEIADVFVVNKADLPGAERLQRDLRTMLNVGVRTSWTPPIVATVATHPDERIDAVWHAIDGHRAYLHADPAGRATRAQRLREAAAAIVGARARAWALAQLDEGHLAAAEHQRTPAAVGRRLWAQLAGGGTESSPTEAPREQ
jgi:LAO/AO transport system kinase